MKAIQNISAVLTLLILAITWSGCKKYPCIDGNGNILSENRTVDPFTGIISEGIFDVEIIQDSITSVVVEAEDNLLPYISTRTDDGVLTIKIREQRCIRNTVPLKIVVRTPNLELISLDGSGEIICDSLNTNDLVLKIIGSGDIHLMLDSCNFLEASILGSGNMYLNGINTESEMKISGSGSIKAANLKQETVFANISGAGNMYLWVTKFLDVKISGSGSVYYSGNPTINVTITGSGSVIHN